MPFSAIIEDHLQVIHQLANQQENILEFASLCRTAITKGNKIFFMGNGGSASDAQHLAAEFVGRFEKERIGLPAIALTTDTSILTAVGNDYGFGQVFSRQIAALARSGDVVVGISTSGNSVNVVQAIAAAKEIGAVTVGLTGESGGQLDEVCDLCIKVPSRSTARIQEAHILIGHIVCALVDEVVE